jgi:Cu-processing system permease protein
MSPLSVLHVARDLLREARARRWTLALVLAATLGLLLVAFGLRLEVVDGALAASRFLGARVNGDIRPADVALRPLFDAVAHLVFYGGTLFGVAACSDFAPALLAPGRIEPLLALPVRRAELLLGTFAGVLALVLAGSLYAGGGLAVVVWVKTGVLGVAPVAAALLAAVAFSAIYAVMLLAALAVRSPALSALAGFTLWILGIVASHRAAIAPMFSPGPGRSLFLAATAPLPRISALGSAASRVAQGGALDAVALAAPIAAAVAFALAALSLAVAIFERRDF